jgi:ABC-2 type transport system permease protein
LALARSQFGWIIKSLPFIVMVLFGLLNFWGAARSVAELYGTKVFPVSYLMVDAIQGGMQWLLVIIVTLYAGELVWRERAQRMHEIVDASPVSNLGPLLAKVAALIAVIAVFSGVGILAGMGYQILRGYPVIEPWVYFTGVGLSSLYFVVFALFALAVQTIVHNKFLGYAITIAALLMQIALPAMDFTHNLYILGATPTATYSDMNGWGPFVHGTLSFNAYWLSFALLLLLLGCAFAVRGVADGWRLRARQALVRLRSPLGLTLGVALIAFFGLGGYTFYNTNVLNEFVPPDTALDRQADYERRYKPFSALPQPRIVGIKADVDLFPREGRAQIRGEYRLKNVSGEPIETVVLQMFPETKLNSFTLPPHRVREFNEQANLRILDLVQPIPPDAEWTMNFASTIDQQGFPNGAPQVQVVENGSFFNNRVAFPSFGYQSSYEITDRNERRKRDLGEPRRMPKLEDEAARANTYIANDADWVTFETTVSTDPDQIALSPGYLQREWTDAGRRYFHYKMDVPMLPFFSYLSARWEVTRGEWRGLPIEVYHDPKHSKNVARMIESVQDSLDYFSANFSDYQHRQVRIIEFPRYATFAQAFANTIPYSESIGFIADLRDAQSIDYVYYVTAHEIAHQWWAHQVIGADMQGSTLMSESLAQYSALMVMEKKYGPEKMRKFLRYELDSYLRGRSGEQIEELPLYRVENQPYVHYRKGALVFYRLRDQIGEQTLNEALAAYIKTVAFQTAPYTTSRELIAEIRARAPADKQQLITDLFEKITLYDNRVVEASVSERDDGRYDVKLKLKAAKLYFDGQGKETPATIDEMIDIGVFSGSGEQQKALYLKPHRVTQNAFELTFTVAEKPSEVGIDPLYKLIDRVIVDNRKKVN